MLIGLDLDNTIVCYDAVFQQLGSEAGLPNEVVQGGKLRIRNFLREQNREDEWTVMQGVAYGPRMGEAAPFEGALEFIGAAKNRGHEFSVVSHRTRHPYLGAAHDLHASAMEWLQKRGVDRQAAIYLEERVEDKARRIGDLGCDVFVDDLPEFLARVDFPARARRIHFDPAGQGGAGNFETVESWEAIGRLLLG